VQTGLLLRVHRTGSVAWPATGEGIARSGGDHVRHFPGPGGVQRVAGLSDAGDPAPMRVATCTRIAWPKALSVLVSPGAGQASGREPGPRPALDAGPVGIVPPPEWPTAMAGPFRRRVGSAEAAAP